MHEASGMCGGESLPENVYAIDHLWHILLVVQIGRFENEGLGIRRVSLPVNIKNVQPTYFWKAYVTNKIEEMNDIVRLPESMFLVLHHNTGLVSPLSDASTFASIQ